MSRIGRQPMSIPEGVRLNLEQDTIIVRGKKGELKVPLDSRLNIVQKGATLLVERKDNTRKARALHGLTRSLLNNALIGVSVGFVKQLEMVGVGFRAKIDRNTLVLTVGYSHPVKIEAPPGIELQVNNNKQITVLGIDKQKVGAIAAQIRKIRPPEPYKGKGIRYKGELVRRKPGKTAKTVGIGT